MKLASFEALVVALEAAGARYLAAGGLVVHFVSIPTLIYIKEAAGRPKDWIDIEHLRMRLEECHIAS
ncbi:MAG TPA: hypothetical protein VGR01_04180 [Burkholderiales bacterium]|jgi:hypothetical protein|nr:hypothetical protein [Burkholderiales bacterium]